MLEDVQGSVVLGQEEKVAILTKISNQYKAFKWTKLGKTDYNSTYPCHVLSLELRLARISPNLVQSGLTIE